MMNRTTITIFVITGWPRWSLVAPRLTPLALQQADFPKEKVDARRLFAENCATNVTIRDNTSFTSDPNTTNTVYAVEVRQAAQVEISTNTVDDSRLNACNAFMVWNSAQSDIAAKHNVGPELVTNVSPLIDKKCA